jgi:hypothetical protein
MSRAMAAGRPLQSFTARRPLLCQPAIGVYVIQYPPMPTFLSALTPWLDPNPNSWSAHLFLHWVEKDGRYRDQAFDRPAQARAVQGW